MTSPIMIFRDTVNPGVLSAADPAYQGVLGYANGRYAWPQSQFDRFIRAGKRVHKIDVTGGGWDIADVLDVESHDATPHDVPAWLDQRWAHHSTAAVYCSLSAVPSVLAVLGGRPMYLIVADWTGAPHVPAQLHLPPHVILAGVQYENTPSWDLTAIYSRPWLEGAKIA